MTELLEKVITELKKLPPDQQDAIASRWMDELKEEQQWQETLEQPQSSFLDELAKKALNESSQGKTKKIGFDEI
ncbi:hypothetical protein [Crocosphaera sp.]|uniref:hypothetical protein n=1 Tax=Crocosphaera sp. TaxID=2729996 RepID=UPI003F287484